MKRKDFIILLAVLAAGAILFFATGRRLPGTTQSAGSAVAASVRITVPDQETRLVPLDASRQIVIDQESGEHNVVTLVPGGFFMSESNCKNQDCIKQATVTPGNVGERALGNQVICLPNKVVLELVAGEPTEVLEIVP